MGNGHKDSEKQRWDKKGGKKGKEGEWPQRLKDTKGTRRRGEREGERELATDYTDDTDWEKEGI